jgi:dihydrofolate synthase/folylpolyglutamate synthase
VDRKKLLVFGVMKDKDFNEMLAALKPVVQQIILTKPRIPRAAAPDDVALHAPGAIIIDSVKDAIEEASRAAGIEGLVIVAGSFYTIGEAKEILHEAQ